MAPSMLFEIKFLIKDYTKGLLIRHYFNLNLIDR